MASKWDAYQKVAAEAATEIIEKTGPITEKIPQEKMNLIAGGRKRREYGSTSRPPLPDCSVEDSERIRHIVALRFAGYTLAECAEEVELNPGYIQAWMTRNQDAVGLAEQEQMERCLRAYQTNLWIVRTGLSELGPRAIRTLAEIMADRKASHSTRKDCAIAVLKLMDVDHSATGGTNEGLAKEFVSFLKEARREINSERIVEADEAEVIEDGDDGNLYSD